MRSSRPPLRRVCCGAPLALHASSPDHQPFVWPQVKGRRDLAYCLDSVAAAVHPAAMRLGALSVLGLALSLSGQNYTVRDLASPDWQVRNRAAVALIAVPSLDGNGSRARATI